MTTSPAPAAAPSVVPAPKAAAKPLAPKAKPSSKASAAGKKPAETAKPIKAPRSKLPAVKQAVATAPAAAKDAKDNKAKKPKLVRDSFTIPKDEYAAIDTLKQRCATLAQPVKKSELLRAGLKMLAAMDDAALRAAVQAVPSIKTGRPKADAAAAPAQPADTKATKATKGTRK